MLITALPRGGGKTDTIVDLWLMARQTHDAVLVVVNESDRQRIIERYGVTLVDADKIYTFDSAPHRFTGRPPNVLFVDNADYVLTHYFHCMVDVATVTGEVLQGNPPMVSPDRCAVCAKAEVEFGVIEKTEPVPPFLKLV